MITVFTQPKCKYCLYAKDLLETHGCDYEVIDIESSPEALHDFIERTNAAQTVPQIVVNGCLIGGYERLKAAIKDGSFEQLLKRSK